MGFHMVNTNKDNDRGMAGHVCNPSHQGSSGRIQSSRLRKVRSENKNVNSSGCSSIVKCLPGIHKAPGSIYGSEGRGGEGGGGGVIGLHCCLLKVVFDANSSGSSKVSSQAPVLLQNVISPMGSEDKDGEVCVACWELLHSKKLAASSLLQASLEHCSEKLRWGSTESQSHQVALILEPRLLAAAAAAAAIGKVAQGTVMVEKTVSSVLLSIYPA